MFLAMACLQREETDATLRLKQETMLALLVSEASQSRR